MKNNKNHSRINNIDDYIQNPKNTNKPRFKEFKYFKLIRNIFIVIILLLLAIFILNKAPNYKNRDILGTNLIINNNNITAFLKQNILIQDDTIYISKADIANFFDPYIYYNSKENRIVMTYDTKVTNMILNSTTITINDVTQKIANPAFLKEDVIYIPFSELAESLNVEINYDKNTDIVTADTLSREKTTANSKKNLKVKSIKDTFSRTVAKIKKDDTVTLIENDENNKWSKIKTQSGKIGYVKTKDLTNITIARAAIEEKPQITGNISMLWDYYSEFVEAPERTGKIDGINVISPAFFTLEELGKGNIIDKVGTKGIEYINWAHSNNYKIWGLFANDSRIKTTSEILNSYELRNKTINNILTLATKYKLDGINIDFEYMYKDDKDMFTQFIIELYPRLKEKNIVLSVDVTAPDGAENWSLCFDRHDIAANCDYIVFMAYDQYGNASTKAGTTAGLDWISVGINKFLKTEEIPSNKIILGLPFYTRLWTETSNGKISSNIVDMKKITSALPNDAYKNKVWNEELGQYYVEYKENGLTKKMWIEDERSITAKLELVKSNNLAGAAFWAKDRENNSIWQVINNELSIN